MKDGKPYSNPCDTYGQAFYLARQMRIIGDDGHLKDGYDIANESEEKDQPTREQIESWLDTNKSACDDIRIMIIEQLLNGDTSIEELRKWIITGKYN